jgi:hypothetical protein
MLNALKSTFVLSSYRSKISTHGRQKVIVKAAKLTMLRGAVLLPEEGGKNVSCRATRIYANDPDLALSELRWNSTNCHLT